jgi:hypothetical protein
MASLKDSIVFIIEQQRIGESRAHCQEGAAPSAARRKIALIVLPELQVSTPHPNTYPNFDARCRGCRHQRPSPNGGHPDPTTQVCEA